MSIVEDNYNRKKEFTWKQIEHYNKNNACKNNGLQVCPGIFLGGTSD
jgi:hypothetical protein